MAESVVVVVSWKDEGRAQIAELLREDTSVGVAPIVVVITVKF
jgi:hypothetical protein